MPRLESLTVAGYKSIRECNLSLGGLNILVGANGAGKSNLISAIGLLGEVVNERLQSAVGRAGGAASLLHKGPGVTSEIRLHPKFGKNEYELTLVPTADDGLLIESEVGIFHGDWKRNHRESIGHAEKESGLKVKAATQNVARFVRESMLNWRVFHFHDTSQNAPPKTPCDVSDNLELRSDASNVAAFLFRLQVTDSAAYQRIVDSVRLVAPFFEDFVLAEDRLQSDKIRLEWRQRGSDAYCGPSALSDGTLRFICLATLLLQPRPPSVVIIDEPELGLHPFAINQLAGMFRSVVAAGSQLLVSTQSVTLLNHVDASDVIIVEQHDGESSFERPTDESLSEWVGEYSMGELWEKNLLGGRPY